MKLIVYASFRRPVAACLIGLFLASAAASAQAGTANVTCSSSSRQGNLVTCNGYATVTLNSTSPDLLYALRLTAPSAHCSPVSYGVTRAPYATGADALGATGALNGGMSEFVYLGRNWAPGAYPLRVSATGYVAGCNTGALGSWGVNWEVVIVPQ